MKFFTLFQKFLFALLLFLLAGNNSFCQTTVNFVYIGSSQTWTVPGCVNTITVAVNGAQGGCTNGGLGAVVTATLSVTPAQVLQINVGGQGSNPAAGWNGGGAGQSSSTVGYESCGGGGASDIRITPYSLTDRVVVAGAGGGMGGGDQDALGGDGGCATGGTGTSPFGQGGSGGTQTAGGAGGPPWAGCTVCTPGSNGALGIGGAGAPDLDYNLGPGGGGGGGYYGGGGGGSDDWQTPPLGGGGGGGGSSLVPAGGNCTQATNPGNGAIAITYSGGGLTAAVNSTPESCSAADGTATATPSGGASPYTYAWSTLPPQTTQTATGLSAGTYTVLISDAGGCTTTATVAVTSSSGLTATSSSTPENCSAANGTATASPSGGTSPYTYLWNPTGQTTSTATGLSAGNYTVVIADSSGCNTQVTVTVGSSANLSVTASSTPDGCSSGTGTATASPSGGNSPYTYSWTTSPTQTTQMAIGLTAGTYVVTVTDVNGCSSSATVTVTSNSSPPSVTALSPSTICFGQTTANLSAFAPTAVSYTWSPTTGLSCSSCANTTANPAFTNTYTVYVTDAGGCTNSASVPVTVGVPPVVTVTPPVTICVNDTAFLTSNPQGPVQQQPYNYYWTPPTAIIYDSPTTNLSQNPLVSPITTTPFCVYVTDNWGCKDTACTLVTVIQKVSVTVTSQPDTICLGDTITLCSNINNATSYWWSPGGQTTTCITVVPTSSTYYSVTGTDLNVCFDSDSVEIMVGQIPQLTVVQRHCAEPLVASEHVHHIYGHHHR
ncbi:MAG: hypothetical protein HY063_09745 [Bacteroidetes bacterium]|nr:hypothetical protein [Bacteroidota bacterium]